MLNRNELNEYMKTLKFQNLQQIETDYLQYIILAGLYSNPLSKALVFKGGTALQKIYSLNRFSIDLDFTTNLTENDINSILEKVKIHLNRNGIENTFEVSSTDNSIIATFKLHGPVYAETENKYSISTIRLDFSRRERSLIETKKSVITPPYIDIFPCVITSMDPNEILAEKFRAIMTRDKIRDIFDFNFLLNKGFYLFYGIVEKKMLLYNTVDLSLEKFIEKIKSISNDLWKREIENIIYASEDIEVFSGFKGMNETINNIEDYIRNNPSFKVRFNTESKDVVRNNEGRIIKGIFSTFRDIKDQNEYGIYTKDDYEIHLINLSPKKTEEEKTPLELSIGIDEKSEPFPFSSISNNEMPKIYIKRGHNFYLKLFIDNDSKIKGEIEIGVSLKPIKYSTK